MEPTDDSELKRFEELKRDKMLGPTERLRLLQEMITWADAQRPVPRNSPAGALAAQRVLSRGWRKRRTQCAGYASAYRGVADSQILTRARRKSRLII